jgi:hypothetical protein
MSGNVPSRDPTSAHIGAGGSASSGNVQPGFRHDFMFVFPAGHAISGRAVL